MIVSLRGNQRSLHTRQNLFCLRQRQPQIGDLGKAGGSIDLYQVDTICRAVAACFDQSQNPTHARSPGQKDKDRRIAPAPYPQSLDSPETNDVEFLFGLAQNSRLNVEIAADLAAAAEASVATGKPARRFKDFKYRTLDSWSRERRVIGKAEWMTPSLAEADDTTPRRKKKKAKKARKAKAVAAQPAILLPGRANPRFIVTSLKAAEHEARALYEKRYCARGEMENHIKECQLDLFADRTSSHTMRANQLRLWLASFAYVLTSALRRIGLANTRLADATCGTIRLKLLKIGALVKISFRRILFSMASAFPYVDDYAAAWAALHSAA
jgi:hypothetical protein